MQINRDNDKLSAGGFRRAGSVTGDDKEGRKWAKAQGGKKDIKKRHLSVLTPADFEVHFEEKLHKEYMEQSPQKL